MLPVQSGFTSYVPILCESGLCPVIEPLRFRDLFKVPVAVVGAKDDTDDRLGQSTGRGPCALNLNAVVAAHRGLAAPFPAPTLVVLSSAPMTRAPPIPTATMTAAATAQCARRIRPSLSRNGARHAREAGVSSALDDDARKPGKLPHRCRLAGFSDRLGADRTRRDENRRSGSPSAEVAGERVRPSRVIP